MGACLCGLPHHEDDAAEGAVLIQHGADAHLPACGGGRAGETDHFHLKCASGGTLPQLLKQREQLGSLGRDNVEQHLARVLCPCEAGQFGKASVDVATPEFVIEDPNPDGRLGEQLLQLVGRERA